MLYEFYRTRGSVKRIRKLSAHYDNTRDVTLMCQHHIHFTYVTYFTHLITLHNAQLKLDLLSFYYYLALLTLFPFAGYEPKHFNATSEAGNNKFTL